jgi:hypothetical protein
MFERTKTFWRRLVGNSTQTGNLALALEDKPDERRVWARFPADLETSLKTAGAADSTRLQVRVRNISLGGVNLLVERSFEPGTMLSIELPGASEETHCTVLACVVHCVQDEDNQWSLGCDFSRELSEADLASFGARRERHGASDKREWKRYPCNVSSTYQLVAADDQTAYPAKVLNISASGVGLQVNRFVENGALLSVELHNSAGTTERTMLACVVHVNHLAEGEGEGEWALGCNFIRSLAEEDLKALA